MQEPAAQGAPKGVDSCLFVCRGDDQEKEKDSKSLFYFFLVICFAHSNLLSLVCRSCDSRGGQVKKATSWA
jgi:hypothetical protein